MPGKSLNKTVTDKDKKQQMMDDLLDIQAKCKRAIEQYESGNESRNYLHQALASISIKTGELMTKEQAETLLV